MLLRSSLPSVLGSLQSGSYQRLWMGSHGQPHLFMVNPKYMASCRTRKVATRMPSSPCSHVMSRIRSLPQSWLSQAMLHSRDTDQLRALRACGEAEKKRDSSSEDKKRLIKDLWDMRKALLLMCGIKSNSVSSA